MIALFGVEKEDEKRGTGEFNYRLSSPPRALEWQVTFQEIFLQVHTTETCGVKTQESSREFEGATHRNAETKTTENEKLKQNSNMYYCMQTLPGSSWQCRFVALQTWFHQGTARSVCSTLSDAGLKLKPGHSYFSLLLLTCCSPLSFHWRLHFETILSPQRDLN